jgi:hypothetical protein
MRLLAPVLSCQGLVHGAMMPVDEPEVVLNSQQLPAPELEGLLHFAIRNSNLTKLREMAENAEDHFSTEKFNQLINALEETDRIIKDTVNKTFISRSWESDDEFIAAIELLQDYGDHLVDKGDMLHKMHALEPLLDWITVSDTKTPELLSRLLEFVFDITQNREPTKALVLELRPNIVEQIYSNFVTEWRCDSNEKESDEVCASLVMVINALIGNNEQIQKRLDQPIISSLSKLLSRVDPSSALFTRLLSTFKLLSQHTEESEWIKAVDIPAFLVNIDDVKQVTVGLKAIEFAEFVCSIRKCTEDLGEYRPKLHAKCMQEKGENTEWCNEIKSVGQRNLDEL